jgi:HPt (histidine-containing phosphotransfer) domain-containing protein
MAQGCGDQRPRIVAMTADAMQGDRERCLEAGMDEYLTKPIRTAEMVDALQRASTFPRGEAESILVESDERSRGPNRQVVDQEVLNSMIDSTGGDPFFVAELLDDFAAEAPKMLTEAGEALASGDVDIVRRTAHTLKSNALTFGANALSSLCADLEAAAKEGGLSGGPELLARIESEYALVVDELRSARNRLAAS